MTRTSSRRRRAALVGAILSAALLVTVVVSARFGQFSAGFDDVLGSIGRVAGGWFGSMFGADNPGAATDPDVARIDAALWAIRFPRAILAVLVGACLAVAGAVMQGVFANPLAEPSIIGVNSGASVGASVVFVFGLAGAVWWAVPIAAFAGAVAVALAVWALSRTAGTAAVITLILTGIAINAVAVAATSFLIFLGDAASREQIIFWQLGTLSNATWPAVTVTALVLAAGFGASLVVRRQIDVLALGDAAASATGVNVERLRVAAITLVSVLTAVAVAFGGVIAFVGLIVPHALRLAVGPSHRYLIPLSALGGALLLSLADIAARTVIPFADLPIGIFTAVVGGPLFLLMLRRTLRGYRAGR